jgi:hypothetical protein
VRGTLLAMLVACTFACRRDEGGAIKEPPPKHARKPKTTPALLDRYPIRRHVEWTDNNEMDGKKTTTRMEEIWTPLDDAKVRAWKVVSRPIDKSEPDIESRYELRPEGIVYVSITIDGTVIGIEPPKLSLPVDAHVGQTWGGAHLVGKKANDRRCRLTEHDGCSDGLEEQCTTEYPDGRKTEVANHYCGGIGWSGYTSRTVQADGKSQRNWSTEVTDAKEP